MVSLKQSEPLVQLLRERALKRGQKQKLASGLESDVYVNCKDVTLHGPSLWTLSGILVQALQELDARATHCAGVSVGGDPIVAGMIAYASRELRWSLEALLVRKNPKEHGASAGRATEGSNASPTQRVWLVEDVVSTGGSALIALQHLKREGYPVVGMLTLVDREMGGSERITRETGVRVVSLCKLSQLTVD